MKHLLAFALLLALALPSFADEKKTDAKETKPADNEASLDDLLKLPGAEKKPDDKTRPLPKSDVPATGDESVDAILKAIAEMDQAGQRLGIRQDPGIQTQRLQESVLARLDQAIAIAQKQKQQQQQQKQQQQGQGQQKQENGSQQNQPQQKPGDKQASKPGEKDPKNGESNKNEQVSPEKVDPTTGGPIEESRIEWGRLPARIRGELDQGLAEKFSPLYKKLTEAYYRRLAEEGKD